MLGMSGVAFGVAATVGTLEPGVAQLAQLGTLMGIGGVGGYQVRIFIFDLFLYFRMLMGIGGMRGYNTRFVYTYTRSFVLNRFMLVRRSSYDPKKHGNGPNAVY